MPSCFPAQAAHAARRVWHVAARRLTHRVHVRAYTVAHAASRAASPAAVQCVRAGAAAALLAGLGGAPATMPRTASPGAASTAVEATMTGPPSPTPMPGSFGRETLASLKAGVRLGMPGADVAAPFPTPVAETTPRSPGAVVPAPAFPPLPWPAPLPVLPARAVPEEAVVHQPLPEPGTAGIVLLGAVVAAAVRRLRPG